MKKSLKVAKCIKKSHTFGSLSCISVNYSRIMQDGFPLRGAAQIIAKHQSSKTNILLSVHSFLTIFRSTEIGSMYVDYYCWFELLAKRFNMSIKEGELKILRKYVQPLCGWQGIWEIVISQ